MSQDGNSNTQTPAAPPTTPVGPTMEELQAKVAELERAREGLIRDTQEERRKRQDAESRLNTSPAPSPAQPDVNQDELGKVLKPYIEPVRQEAAAAKALLQRYEEDKALEVIAAKLGKPKQDVMTDQKFQERFLATQKRYGITASSLTDLTMKTMELMDLEDLKVKDAERSRQAQAQSNASMPSGTAPAPVAGKRSMKAAEFEKMSMAEYDKLQSAGSFIQDPESGEIVYTPH